MKFWRFSKFPFENNNHDFNFFYNGTQYNRIISEVYQSITKYNLDVLVICGDIGVGKSFSSLILKNIFAKQEFYVAYLFNAASSEKILYMDLIKSLTKEQITDLDELHSAFTEILDYIRRIGKHIVIIMDEAQQYSKKMLDILRTLVNYNQDGYKYLSLILVGQPELSSVIKQNVPINSRVREIYYLKNLNQEEVKEYIQFRLKTAGGNIDTFNNYYEAIYQLSKGSPRIVNFICSSILEDAFERKRLILSDDITEITFERYRE